MEELIEIVNAPQSEEEEGPACNTEDVVSEESSCIGAVQAILSQSMASLHVFDGGKKGDESQTGWNEACQMDLGDSAFDNGGVDEFGVIHIPPYRCPNTSRKVTQFSYMPTPQHGDVDPQDVVGECPEIAYGDTSFTLEPFINYRLDVAWFGKLSGRAVESYSPVVSSSEVLRRFLVGGAGKADAPPSPERLSFDLPGALSPIADSPQNDRCFTKSDKEQKLEEVVPRALAVTDGIAVLAPGGGGPEHSYVAEDMGQDVEPDVSVGPLPSDAIPSDDERGMNKSSEEAGSGIVENVFTAGSSVESGTFQLPVVSVTGPAAVEDGKLDDVPFVVAQTSPDIIAKKMPSIGKQLLVTGFMKKVPICHTLPPIEKQFLGSKKTKETHIGLVGQVGGEKRKPLVTDGQRSIKTFASNVPSASGGAKNIKEVVPVRGAKNGNRCAQETYVQCSSSTRALEDAQLVAHGEMSTAVGENCVGVRQDVTKIVDVLPEVRGREASEERTNPQSSHLKDASAFTCVRGPSVQDSWHEVGQGRETRWMKTPGCSIAERYDVDVSGRAQVASGSGFSRISEVQTGARGASDVQPREDEPSVQELNAAIGLVDFRIGQYREDADRAVSHAHPAPALGGACGRFAPPSPVSMHYGRSDVASAKTVRFLDEQPRVHSLTTSPPLKAPRGGFRDRRFDDPFTYRTLTEEAEERKNKELKSQRAQSTPAAPLQRVCGDRLSDDPFAYRTLNEEALERKKEQKRLARTQAAGASAVAPTSSEVVTCQAKGKNHGCPKVPEFRSHRPSADDFEDDHGAFRRQQKLVSKAALEERKKGVKVVRRHQLANRDLVFEVLRPDGTEQWRVGDFLSSKFFVIFFVVALFLAFVFRSCRGAQGKAELNFSCPGVSP